jgi:Uncharacterized protein family UPF0016
MWSSLLSVFTTVFLAEIGDKTQLATMLFAADREVNRWLVFAGASLALVAAAALGVLVGAQIEHFVKPSTLRSSPASTSSQSASGPRSPGDDEGSGRLRNQRLPGRPPPDVPPPRSTCRAGPRTEAAGAHHGARLTVAVHGTYTPPRCEADR